jgi:hypothetical protein
MLKIYNMKKLILILLFISTNVFSQNAYDAIAKETCECTTKLDIESMDSSDLELNFGLCMLQSYNNHINEFSESEKLDFDNDQQMEKFGSDIAIKMLQFCPDLILRFGDTSDDDESNTNEDLVTSGSYVGYKLDTFYNIIVKESNGETAKFVVLDYFDNVNLITDKLLKINDTVSISYYLVELFDAKLNRFVSVKVVTDIIKK